MEPRTLVTTYHGVSLVAKGMDSNTDPRLDPPLLHAPAAGGVRGSMGPTRMRTANITLTTTWSGYGHQPFHGGDPDDQRPGHHHRNDRPVPVRLTWSSTTPTPGKKNKDTKRVMHDDHQTLQHRPVDRRRYCRRCHHRRIVPGVPRIQRSSPRERQNFSPGHSHPSLTTPRNPAPNREKPLNPQQPTPVNVPKPTPPPNLYAGGQIGAQATSQWYLDLWAYAFNTGDTEDFMKVCQVEGYCDEFAHDLERMHTDAYLVKPLTNQYLQTNKIYECSLQRAGTKGICIEFTYLQTSATFGYLTVEKASEQYDTISTVTGEEINNEQRFFRVLFLEERGDTWIVTHIWDH